MHGWMHARDERLRKSHPTRHLPAQSEISRMDADSQCSGQRSVAVSFSWFERLFWNRTSHSLLDASALYSAGLTAPVRKNPPGEREKHGHCRGTLTPLVGGVLRDAARTTGPSTGGAKIPRLSVADSRRNSAFRTLRLLTFVG